MDEKTFQAKMTELLQRIKELPAAERPRLEKLAEETRDRHNRIRESVSSLQDALDHLRLSVKYLVFDLEATRRENQYLRKLVEQANRDRTTRQDEDTDNFLSGEDFD